MKCNVMKCNGFEWWFRMVVSNGGFEWWFRMVVSNDVENRTNNNFIR